MQLADCEAMLVTQSEHGMTLVPRNGEAIHVPAHPVRVRDVSGAGDTVAAVLAVTLAAGADWETALRMANAAAAVAVSKKGTATVTSAELRRKILPHAFLAAEEKIVAAAGELDAQLLEWRKQGLRIGFTNGCFDILHPGHVKVLTAARGACDRLIVGLNSDASVKRLKGEGRPVQNERARAEVLAALEAVDLVVIFEEDTPIKLITRDQAERAGEGRRLHPRAGCRPRDRRSLWRRSACWSISCRASARRRWSTARAEAGRERATQQLRRHRSVLPVWRDPAGLGDDGGYLRGPDRALAAVVDVAGRRSSRSSWLVDGGADARLKAFLRSLKRPICVLPIALFALALVGTLWSDAAWGARLYAVSPTVKLLVLPVLFYHFERSARGMWVFIAFLVSCALLMAMSWIVAFDPQLRAQVRRRAEYGVPVKNYIDQSQEFALCAVALAYPIISLLRAKKIRLALLLVAISLELRRQHGVCHRFADGAGHDADHAGGIRAASPEMANQPDDFLRGDRAGGDWLGRHRLSCVGRPRHS